MDRSAGTAPRRRRNHPFGRALLVALLVLVSACASYDERVLDERLRSATFDAYVHTIEAQFGGLGAAGWTADGLRAAYRDRAVGAAGPAEFYGVLRQLLAELDDPHATLKVSPRFWAGPVAEPEWVRFVEGEDAVWLGVPRESVRSPDEFRAQMRLWLAAAGAGRLEDLDARGIATFLRTSAAYGLGNQGRRARAQPLAWLHVDSIDGAPVESSHDAELLVRGALGSAARVVARTATGLREVALLRNSGVFEQEETRARRFRLHPLELAERLDPRLYPIAAADAVRIPFGAEVAARRTREACALAGARPLRAGGADAELYDAEAYALRTPRGADVAYLRLGAFRPDPNVLLERGLSEDEDWERMDRVLGEALRELGPFRNWVIDLSGNPGGAWRNAGLFMSYLMPPEEGTIPHVVRSVRLGRRLFWKVRVIETTRLERAPVPFLGDGRTILVLVDQDTASAGEIVASMLRGRHGATLVGERTAGAEYSTAEFLAPDGSTLQLGLGGGMVAPLESFQGEGLEPDIAVRPEVPLGDGPERLDPEIWRAVFRYRALEVALRAIDDESPRRTLPAR